MFHCNIQKIANSIKKKYRIVTRRSTVKKIRSQNEELLKENAKEFVNRVNAIVDDKHILPSRVFNADQTGINYEITTQRTLEYKNRKHVHSTVCREFDTTHSYSLQIYISQDGKLGKRLFIVLREPKGQFGPRIQPVLNRLQGICRNVKVACSTSGKFDAALLDNWIAMFKEDNNINYESSEKSMLIWDDFSPQRSKRHDIHGSFTTEVIPAKTTRFCQPLDARFNLQYKIFYKTLFNELKYLVNIDRYYIIKLNSIIYNQLSHQVFADLVKFCWSVCGYQSTALNGIHNFKNVKSICFTSLEKCSNCENHAAMKCVYCQKALCFNHLIIENIHLHLNWIYL